jgi:hypothetical protein
VSDISHGDGGRSLRVACSVIAANLDRTVR